MKPPYPPTPKIYYFFFGVALLLPALSCATPTPTSPTDYLTELWSLTRGGSRLDQGWGVDVDDEGNVYLATYQQAENEPYADMVIYKIGANGGELWQQRWGTNFMEKAFIVTVAAPFVYVGGLTYRSAALTEADMVVLALNMADGSLVWDFEWGQGFGYEEVDGLVVAEDGLYVAGWTTGAETSNDLALLKLSLAGTLLWWQSWGTAAWDQADGQLVVDAENIYLSGRYNAQNILLGGQGLLAQFERANGHYVAHQSWGGPIFTDALGLTSDGTFLYAVGLTLDAGNGGQIFLRKYDKELKLIWEQVWGGPGGESARAVAVDAAGRIWVAGETASIGNGRLDIVILHYDPDGRLLGSQSWGGVEDEGALGLVPAGNALYVVGKTRSFGNGQDDIVLLKLAIANEP